MATDLTGLYIEAYHATLATGFEQKDSVLTPLVDDCGQFVGNDLFVPWIGTNEADEFTRTGSAEMAELDSGYKQITPLKRKHTHPLYDYDKNKHTVAAAATVATKSKQALMRAKDKIIYDAMRAAPTGTGAGQVYEVGDYSKRLSFEFLADAAGILGDRYCWDDGQMAMILPFSVGLGLGMDLNVSEKSNSEKAVIKELGNMLDPLASLKIAAFSNVYQNSPSAGVIGCDIFLWNKESVAAAHNNTFEKIDQPLSGGKVGRTIGAWLDMGAIVRDPKAIVKIKCQFNAAKTFVPFRTQQVA